jgi:hypothetical protein
MTSERVPDVILEQYRLGELPPEDAARVRQLLRTDPAIAQRLEALDRSDEDIRRTYPPAWLAQRIQERAGRQPGVRSRHRFVRHWGLPLALATASTALVLTIPQHPVAPGGPSAAAPGTERVKGLRPALSVYRRTDRGSETLADGAVARAGDLLRLGITRANRSHGVVLSIDGRGAITVHLPPAGGRAAPLGGGRTLLLDQAYELDDAPGWERFYLVTGAAPFDVDPLVDAARRAAARDPRSPPGPLAIPRDLDQFLFLLQKEVRP